VHNEGAGENAYSDLLESQLEAYNERLERLSSNTRERYKE